MSRTLLVFIVVTLLALAPRTLAPERFTTADEAAFWFYRSENFSDGLSRGELGRTWQAPHPGVTTMWAGTFGRAVWVASGRDPDGRMTVEEEHHYRLASRFFVSLFTSLCIGGAAAGLSRLRPLPEAALASLLLAFDPFFVAHSKILHNDALTAAFFLVAIVAGWGVATGPAEDTRRWLIRGSIAVALATLSKLSGVLAALAIGGAFVARSWAESADLDPATRRQVVLRHTGRAAALCVGVGVAVIVVMWPAVWADPGAVIEGFSDGLRLGSSAHEQGNYFAGEIIADPGRAFYPVVVALRTTPLTFLGLLLGVVAAARGDRFGRYLLVCTLGYLLIVGEQGKKFDRYALPAFPLIDILAAVGWAGLARWVGRSLEASLRPVALAAAVGVAVIGAAAPIARSHPYEIQWFNPMFGGAPAARWWLLYGWGEGLEEAGDFIREHSDTCAGFVTVQYPQSIKPFVCQRVRTLRMERRASWVVLYANQVQRDRYDAVTAKYLDAREPDHVVRRFGVDLAWVYKGPKHPDYEADPDTDTDADDDATDDTGGGG